MRISNFTPIILVGGAYGCQQFLATLQTTEYACKGYNDAGLQQRCQALVPWFEDYSKANMNRLGQSAQYESFWCDECNDSNNLNPKCYCGIRFWRLREWMGRVPDPPADTKFMYKGGSVIQKVHCD